MTDRHRFTTVVACTVMLALQGWSALIRAEEQVDTLPLRPFPALSPEGAAAPAHPRLPPANHRPSSPMSPPHHDASVSVPHRPAADGGAGDPPASGTAGAVDPDARFTHFRVGDRNVKSLLADGDTLWVGTSAGVVRYDTLSDTYRLFDLRSGLLANGVFHLGWLDGRLAVGTYGGGLAVMRDDNESWRLYNIPDGLADAFVYDVLDAANGDVWIATWSGANRIAGGALDDVERWRTYTVENTGGGLPNDWVYAIEQDKHGVVWFATEGGLARFDGSHWQNWRHEDGLGAPYESVREQIEYRNDPARYSEHHARQKVEMGLDEVDIAYNPNYIVALAVDENGVVWCGTWGGGLARLEGQRWINETMAQGLPGNHVFMLHIDPEGALWVGTSNGLARRDTDGSYTVYTTRDGLYSNTVFAMATGRDGSRWIGSFGGAARIAKLD